MFVDFQEPLWPSNTASGSEMSQIGIFIALWNYNDFIWIVTPKMLFWYFWPIFWCSFYNLDLKNVDFWIGYLMEIWPKLSNRSRNFRSRDNSRKAVHGLEKLSKVAETWNVKENGGAVALRWRRVVEKEEKSHDWNYQDVMGNYFFCWSDHSHNIRLAKTI